MNDRPGFTRPNTSRRRFWIAGAIISIGLIALVIFGLRFALNKQLKTSESIIHTGLKNERFIDASGASLAFAATSYAESHSDPFVAMTPSILDKRLSAAHWVDGATAVRYLASGIPQVSFAVDTQHVVTAFQVLPEECSFGLVVSSPQDPIVSVDHLGGAGTYEYDEIGTTRCSAAAAPSTWLPARPYPLSSLPNTWQQAE